MKLYRGIPWEDFIKISASRKFRVDNTIWNCSDNNFLYFWNAEKLAKGEQRGKRESTREAIQYALDSARFTAACIKSKADKIVVLELTIPEDMKWVVEDDSSCENMDYASQIRVEEVNIEWVTRVYYQPFSLLYGLLIVRSNLNNEYVDLTRFFKELEISMISALASSEIMDYEFFYELGYKVLPNWKSYLLG